LSKTILLVEDEAKIASVLADYINREGYTCHCLDNGGLVIDWVKREQPELILLDIMLPERDGISLCKAIREFSTVPIFFLTARIAEIDRLKGLDIGADDYICKPYSAKEVVARINASFRRRSGFSNETPSVAGFKLNKDHYQASYQDTPLNLTPSEYRVLALLLDKPGKVLSRDTLLDALHDDKREVIDRAVDTHIKNLRKKILQITADKEVIQSVYGLGYKIEA
jgi:two-component system response regulator BaeR